MKRDCMKRDRMKRDPMATRAYEDALYVKRVVADLLLWPRVRPITPPFTALDWLSKHLVGVGVSNPAHPVLQFYVKSTIPERFKCFLTLPRFVRDIIKHVPFQILETGPFRLTGGAPAPAGPAQAPLQSGASIRLGSGPLGTLCAFVKIGGQDHLVSCSHVLNGTISQAVQLSGHVVANLSQKVDLLPAAPGTAAKADCARALLATGLTPVLGLPHGLGNLTSATPTPPIYGNAVRSAGRHATTGRVDATSADLILEFAKIEAGFEDQILIRGDSGPFAYPGDSGSLVVDVSQTGQTLPLGMAFATNDTSGLVGGSPTYDFTAICPLQAVLDSLGGGATLMF